MARTTRVVAPQPTIHQILVELNLEITKVQRYYNSCYERVIEEIGLLDNRIKTTTNTAVKLELLLLKLESKQLKLGLKRNEYTEVSKIRYIKGLQIMKILYEKTLALDHHFASLNTFNEINNISNPNHYPEFEKFKTQLQRQRDKKAGFRLSTILGENIYTSIIHSFVSMFGNNQINAAEKEKQLSRIDCILDFTLRMHGDLNTIYFETQYLQKSNEGIMQELQQLFVDYTKPIQYHTPLKTCRDTDDWDRVRENLSNYLQELNRISLIEDQKYKAHKMQINLEFPIDRLLQFITQYNAFIDQGAKFYEKFGIMLSSYENEKQCGGEIPVAYQQLKANVAVAIEKFNTAYKPVEINGSKMKEVLYGLTEYD
ncbi:MAG: hypothetical protein CL867_03745 [Cytophagaceae bacterium]|nr:hypothetical protein [Cytophagaceae bacterium]